MAGDHPAGADGADGLVAAHHVTETSSELVVDVVVWVVRGKALFVVAETEAVAPTCGYAITSSTASVESTGIIHSAD